MIPQEAQEPAVEEAMPEDEASESAEIPLSIIPDAKDGEEVKVKVVSVDQDSGMVTVTKCYQKPAGKGSEALAMSVGEQPIEGEM